MRSTFVFFSAQGSRSLKYLLALKENSTTFFTYRFKSCLSISDLSSSILFVKLFNKAKSTSSNCLILGNLYSTVHKGEIQGQSLGIDVDIFTDDGISTKDGEKGELVVKQPFPSMPVKFWGDNDGEKYHKAYFTRFKNIWHHGDYASTTKENWYIIHGRSDATLNSGGVRIGTSEIYRVVENIQNVQECLATELINKNDTEIILFIKTNNSILDDNLIKIIKNKIKNQLSPKHIPKKIISVSDIPKTKSGKIVEIMVKKIINSEKIDNANSLINENCLDEYYEIANKLNSS